MAKKDKKEKKKQVKLSQSQKQIVNIHIGAKKSKPKKKSSRIKTSSSTLTEAMKYGAGTPSYQSLPLPSEYYTKPFPKLHDYGVPLGSQELPKLTYDDKQTNSETQGYIPRLVAFKKPDYTVNEPEDEALPFSESPFIDYYPSPPLAIMDRVKRKRRTKEEMKIVKEQEEIKKRIREENAMRKQEEAMRKQEEKLRKEREKELKRMERVVKEEQKKRRETIGGVGEKIIIKVPKSGKSKIPQLDLEQMPISEKKMKEYNLG